MLFRELAEGVPSNFSSASPGGQMFFSCRFSCGIRELNKPVHEWSNFGTIVLPVIFFFFFGGDSVPLLGKHFIASHSLCSTKFY